MGRKAEHFVKTKVAENILSRSRQFGQKQFGKEQSLGKSRNNPTESTLPLKTDNLSEKKSVCEHAQSLM